MGQYGSATPSIQWGEDRSEDGVMFAVPQGRAPRAKPRKPLGAPGVASGSVTGRGKQSDSQLQVSDSRSGFEEEWERMEGQSSGGAEQSS